MIGSGGREHALIKKLLESPKCTKLYCAPGNGGISCDAECVDIKAMDIDGVVAFAIFCATLPVCAYVFTV